MMSGSEFHKSMCPSPSSSRAQLRHAGRHELAPAHGAGVGAHQLVERIREMLVAEQEQLLELAAEELLARRIVERERDQRIEHAVLAGDAAVVGLDADDRDDDLRRHAVLACRCARAARGCRDRTRRRRRCACRSGRSAGNPSTAWSLRPAARSHRGSTAGTLRPGERGQHARRGRTAGRGDLGGERALGRARCRAGVARLGDDRAAAGREQAEGDDEKMSARGAKQAMHRPTLPSAPRCFGDPRQASAKPK